MSTDDTIDTLNDLIETSRDGEYGFLSARECVDRDELKQFFTVRARECHDAVTELQNLVIELGGKPEDSGTVSGAAHRGWVSAKAKLSTAPSLAILEETERGEDVALNAYRTALASVHLPSGIRQVIERQFDGVKRNHDQVRALRDQARQARS